MALHLTPSLHGAIGAVLSSCKGEKIPRQLCHPAWNDGEGERNILRQQCPERGKYRLNYSSVFRNSAG